MREGEYARFSLSFSLPLSLSLFLSRFSFPDNIHTLLLLINTSMNSPLTVDHDSGDYIYWGYIKHTYHDVSVQRLCGQLSAHWRLGSIPRAKQKQTIFTLICEDNMQFP